MKNVKRLVSILLCAVFSLSALASCSDTTEEEIKRPKRTATEESTDSNYVFEEGDFNGAAFIICSPMDDPNDNFRDNYIDNDEMTGEPINDAVITRNRLVEEKYNVDIQKRKQGSSYALEASKSGTVDFDLVYDWGIRLVPAAMEGIYYSLNKVPYVNLEREYWAPSTQEDLTIADKLLIWTSDISMNRIGYAGFIIFNKSLLDQFMIEYPYELVDRNEWTCDKYIEMFSKVGLDVDGDSQWTSSDVYGTDYYGAGSVIGSSDLPLTFCLKDKDTGRYTVNVFSEKLQQIYTKYKKSLSTNPSIANLGWEDWIQGHDIGKYANQFQAGRVISFAEQHLAFRGTSMSYIPELISEVTDFQFGVVPGPKYETTNEYYHTIDTCSPMFSIPKQAQDMGRTGIILEYLSYQSMNTVLPAYYEQTIKTKCMSDPEGRDEKMLDIIRDSVYYEWTSLYSEGIPNSSGGTWDPIGTMYSEMTAAGNFRSVDKKYHAAAQKALDDFYDMMADMDIDS